MTAIASGTHASVAVAEPRYHHAAALSESGGGVVIRVVRVGAKRNRTAELPRVGSAAKYVRQVGVKANDEQCRMAKSTSPLNKRHTTSRDVRARRR